MAPENIYMLIPRNCACYLTRPKGRCWCDEINALKMRRGSWTIQVDINVITEFLLKESRRLRVREGDGTTGTEVRRT